MTKNTLESLLEQYRAIAGTGASRDLAELEDALRLWAPPHIPRVPQKHIMQWQSQELGVSQHVLSCRRDLWSARGTADALWERVDAGMALGTATRLLRQARKSVTNRRDREALKLAIDSEIRKFECRREDEALPGEVSLPDPSLAPRDFFQRLRRSVLEHLGPRIGALPEHERDRLLEDFERDLRAIMSQHNQKWSKLSRVLQEQQRVSRSRFVNALRVLHMDPPRRNAPLEPVLQQANKQKRTLARLYHPDSHDGSEHTRLQFQAVLDAFLVIEQYVSENQAVSRPPLRVVSGGKK